MLIYSLVGVETPSPTQPGIVDNCDKFCYVQKDNTCEEVAEKNHISVEEFIKWNEGAGPECLTLWANTYACVGVY
ncbi:hypothetical protein J3459_017153 [Metarhizium acridum]|nr:hypothetical protein J3459_017153 [Metarhizium acridum]